MTALNRKLGRDLKGSVGVLVTIIAIIAIGTGSYVGLTSAQRILDTSRATYYNRYQFADFWVDVKKAPQSAVEPIATWPGIAEITSRVVFDVIVDIPNVPRPLSGRLVSAPEQGFADSINGLCLRRGSGFSNTSSGTREEVIISDRFAQENNLAPGDGIELILNRKLESFLIVGTAISPEYVYAVRGEGDIMPDPKHFCVLYVREDYAREVLDFKDACNQITGKLVPGYDGDLELLLDRIKRELDPHGVLSAVPRDRQASHRFLSDEINGLRVTSKIMPAVFLTIAALALNIVLSRLAERQRTIIGTLKAIGYSDREVLTHFLAYGVVIGIVGGLAGDAVGMGLTFLLVKMYPGFFEFPEFYFRFYPDLLLFGVVVSLVFSVAGTGKGVWRVLKLHPAEAMRPKPPERGGAIFFERLPRLWKPLGFRTHIALRSLVRNRGRTITSILSQAVSVAMIFMTLVMYNSMWHLLDYQFEQIIHSDMDIGLRSERSNLAVLEAEGLPAVDYVEPIFGIVCDVQHGRNSRRLGVMGLSPGHSLTTPKDSNDQAIEIPPDGLVLSSKLAEILDAEVGDRLSLTPIRGRREEVRARVASIVEVYLGLCCYADRSYLSSLVGESSAVNSLQLSINETSKSELYANLKRIPNAQNLSVRTDTRESIESTLVESMVASLGLQIMFAGVIAFGSMLNASIMEIGDKRRDISTFRVLGYKSRQIAGIFLRENMVIFIAGLVIAYPLGYGLIMLVVDAYDSELFRMPVVINPSTIITTAAIAVLFTAIVQLFVFRQVRKLDWLEGIKIKE